ncbi:MAG TPA: flagellar basal body rod protein FlgB [Rhodocyclaceae bacterium]|jgi:flagellar basal-body rod protein FlgB|nr:flagellar basal body rod protein FlgB [Rhodocyclaceae bacterium]
MIDRLDKELTFSRTALGLRGYQQELLASNIANADTPNYKARDIDFKSALQNAMSGKGDGSVTMNTTSSRHLQGDGATPYGATLKYRTEYQSNVDGNTVNMDIERTAFAENSIQMEALLTFVRGQFSDLRNAMSAT